MTVKALAGGAGLNAKLAALAAKLERGGTLRVGFLEGATYPDGTPVAAVAAVQEYGAPRAGIPPRPFFRGMIADKSGQWGHALGLQLKATGMDAKASLDALGMGIEGQLQDSIIAMTEPALSPVTLMLRKMFGNQPERITGAAVGEAAERVAAGEDVSGVSTKPLVWTGHLLNSVGHEVKA